MIVSKKLHNFNAPAEKAKKKKIKTQKKITHKKKIQNKNKKYR